MREHTPGRRTLPTVLTGLILAILVAVLLIPLAGCGSTEESSGDVVLRVGSTKSYKTTNKFSDYWYGVLSGITTHDGLIKLGTDMKPVPWLATSWEVSADSKQFTFTIAEGAKWHDGTALTAEDVQFSIEYHRDKVANSAWMKDVIDNIQVDGQHVKLNLKKPYGNLLTEFMTYQPIPKHIWENVDDPNTYDGADRTVGSGPFKLESWDETAAKFTFVANEDYFQGKPNVDKLVVEVFKNMDALVMALSRGDIDTWWDYSGEFPYTYVPTLLKSGDIEFASATFLGVPAALGFNPDQAPTDQLAFRQAVARAINYAEIANLVFYNYGTVPTYGFVPSTHPNFNESIPKIEYDATAAAALLDSLAMVDSNSDGTREAGSQEIILDLLVQNTATNIRCSELVKQYLEAIGIGIQIVSVDSSTWVAKKDAMEYDIAFFRATPWGTLMHAGEGSGYFDSRRTGQGVLHNLSAQEYLDTCDARLETGDADEQRVLDLQLQELNEKYLPGLALVWIESVYPYREGLNDWVIDHIYGGVVSSFSWFTVTRSAN
jgi:peptide/nickel transport system substrate-binding protein